MDDLQARRRIGPKRWAVGLLIVGGLGLAQTAMAQEEKGAALNFDQFRLPGGEAEAKGSRFGTYQLSEPTTATTVPDESEKDRGGLALELMQTNPAEAKLRLGRLYIQSGSLDKALEATNEAIQYRPGWYEALIQRAEIHTRMRRFDEAIADCEQAIEIQPDVPRAYLCRIDTRIQQRDLKRALRETESVLDRWPDSVEGRAYRGNLRREMGQLAGALADFDAVLAKAPGHVGYRKDRLRIEVQANRPELALRDIDWLLEVVPYQPDLLDLRGQSLFRLGRFAEADEALGRAIVANPTNAHLFQQRAEIRALHLHQAEKALEDFAECFALDPENFEGRIWRASIYHQQKRYAEALSDLDRAIAVQPVWTLLAYRALIAEESGDRERALADIERAIELEPKAGPAYFARALLRSKMGQVEDSAADFQRFAELGSPSEMQGAGPIETVLRAIRESEGRSAGAPVDPEVRRAAMRPAEGRR